MLHDYVKVVRGGLATIIMDGGNPNDLSKLLYVPPTMPYPTQYRFASQFAEVQNRSGGSEGFVGIGARLLKSRWKFGTWDDSITTFTDKTTEAQNVSVSDVVLETIDVNDGFVIASQDLFNVVNIVVAVASVGANVRVLEYSKADGTWGSITNAYVLPPTGALQYVISGSAENLIAFEPPMDWDKAVAGHGTNVPVGWYCLRVRATTPPATLAVANSLTIAQAIMGVAQLGNNIMYTSGSGSSEHAFNCLSDGLVAIATTPFAQNVYRVNVRSMG